MTAAARIPCVRSGTGIGPLTSGSQRYARAIRGLRTRATDRGHWPPPRRGGRPEAAAGRGLARPRRHGRQPHAVHRRDPPGVPRHARLRARHAPAPRLPPGRPEAHGRVRGPAFGGGAALHRPRRPARRCVRVRAGRGDRHRAVASQGPVRHRHAFGAAADRSGRSARANRRRARRALPAERRRRARPRRAADQREAPGRSSRTLGLVGAFRRGGRRSLRTRTTSSRRPPCYVEAACTAVSLDPFDALSNAVAGGARHHLGEPERGKAHFERALALGPNDADTLAAVAYTRPTKEPTAALDLRARATPSWGRRTTSVGTGPCCWG